MNLTPHQEEKLGEVMELLAQGHNRIILKGSAGVGKTYLGYTILRRILRPTKWSEDRPYVLAPTHKALSILKNKIDLPVAFATVHSGLKLKRKIDGKSGKVTFVPTYSKGSKKRPLHDCYFVLLDECSMLNTELLNLLDEYNFPIIFMGDDKQLNPVGEPVSPIFIKGYPEVELTEIVRQGVGNPIIELSRDLDMIFFKQPSLVGPHDNLGYTFLNDRNTVINNLAEVNGTDELKYLAYTNMEVDMMNKLVRQKIYGNPKKIEPNESLIFDEPYKGFYTNQEIVVEDLKIVENTIRVPTDKTILLSDGDWAGEYKETKVKMYQFHNDIVFVPHEESEQFLKETIASIRSKCLKEGWDWKAFFYFQEQWAKLTYNHAITVHKSQGSTYKEAVLNIGNIMFCKQAEERQRLLYTAVTRASDLLILSNVK